MGAWGSGPLENDAAFDWVAEFEELGVAAARSAFGAIAAGRDADADASSAVVAACAYVAAAIDGDSSLLDEDEWSSLDPADRSALAGLAGEGARALQQVIAGSELRELWEESGELENWVASSEALLARLRR